MSPMHNFEIGEAEASVDGVVNSLKLPD